jgi:hypothetical protein
MTLIDGDLSGIDSLLTPLNTSPSSQMGTLTSYRIRSPGEYPISSSSIVASHMTLSRVVCLVDGFLGGA